MPTHNLPVATSHAAFVCAFVAACLLALPATVAGQNTVNGYTFENVFDFHAQTGDRIEHLAVNKAGDTAAIVGPVVGQRRMMINGVHAFDLDPRLGFTNSFMGLGIDGSGRVLYSTHLWDDSRDAVMSGIFDGPDLVADAVVVGWSDAQEGFTDIGRLMVRDSGMFAFSGFFADDTPGNVSGKLAGVWSGLDWQADRRMTGLPDSQAGSFGLTFRRVYLGTDNSVLAESWYGNSLAEGVMVSEAPGAQQRELWVLVHPDYSLSARIGNVAINAHGAVAYQAIFPDEDVLYLGDTQDHALPLIITGNDQVWRFAGGVVLDDSGNLLFSGETPGPDAIRGLFTGPDPENDRVLVIGDELFGSTVVGVRYWSYGSFAENGTLAIRYDLADGRRGVAITVIPEPAAAGAVLACLPLLLARRRRDAAS